MSSSQFIHIEVDPEVAEREAKEYAQAYPQASDVVVRDMNGKILRIEKARPGGDGPRV